jgi:deoxyhypusine synthase
MFANLKHQGF